MNTSEEDKARTSSVYGSVSTYFFPHTNHSPRNNLKKSFFITKSSLYFLRILLLIYCLMTLVFTVSLCQNYADFLRISYWSFALLTLYFFLALKSSSSKKSATFFYKVSTLTIVIYEIVFSLQLLNFLAYCAVLLPKALYSNITDFMPIFCELNLYGISFFVVWLDQSFNMIKFNLRHIWFLVIVIGMNIGIAYAISVYTGTLIYEYDLDFKSIKTFVLLLALAVSPFVHFIIGNLHSQFKYKRYQERRKRIRGRILTKNFLKESNAFSYYA